MSRRRRMHVQPIGIRHVTDAVLVDAIAHRYGRREALAGVSFVVAPGELFGLLGPNGSGKSTLFRVLSTLMRPTAGRAAICGYDVVAACGRVRARIGVVFQSPSLDLHLTVRENLLHAGHLYGLRGGELAGRIGESLGRLDLGDRAGDLVKTLSGGLRRRAEIAKCLLHRPAVLLLDEPGAGLDPAARRELRPWLDRLRVESGTAVVLTTHDLDEAGRCGRIAMLDRGRVVAMGTPDELTRRVGGACLTIDTPDPAELCERLSSGLGLRPAIVDRCVRVEGPIAPDLISRIAALGGESIGRLTVGRATLEDVFIHETGRTFESEAA